MSLLGEYSKNQTCFVTCPFLLTQQLAMQQMVAAPSQGPQSEITESTTPANLQWNLSTVVAPYPRFRFLWLKLLAVNFGPRILNRKFQK